MVLSSEWRSVCVRARACVRECECVCACVQFKGKRPDSSSVVLLLGNIRASLEAAAAVLPDRDHTSTQPTGQR